MIRIGSGAGFSGDRIDPAADLAEHGALDYLAFECLAERTIALAVRARMSDPDAGYDPLLEDRMLAVLPACARNGVKVISNMGAANPRGAARAAARVAANLGLKHLRIAAVTGDDVLDAARQGRLAIMDSDEPLPADPLSANAYLGCEAIVAALAEGADVVLTGRVADPSLFLAPMVHEFGWALDDWERLGRGTAIGHLLECAGQITGGYHADPGFKDVADLANLGFPIAGVSADGVAVITKIPGTGGRVTLASCKEQLMYELHDPTAYLTPDVTADFSTVAFTDAGFDRVSVIGGGGRARPERLKVSVGFQDGFLGEGQLTYAGLGCAARGRLALAIVEERLRRHANALLETRFDLIGVDSVLPGTEFGVEPPEVRARVAVRAATEDAARAVCREVEALYTNGPAGGGGVRYSAAAIIGIAPALAARDEAPFAIHWEGGQ